MLRQMIQTHCVRNGPTILRFPAKIMPFFMKKRLIEQMLFWQFRQALFEGELDFLTGRWLKIDVRDIGLSWSMTLANGVLTVAEQAPAEVTFSGDFNDLVLIANHKVDPDMLFFQRRLIIEGDTELGLYVKNLMDAVDLSLLPLPLQLVLRQLAKAIEAES